MGGSSKFQILVLMTVALADGRRKIKKLTSSGSADGEAVPSLAKVPEHEATHGATHEATHGLTVHEVLAEGAEDVEAEADAMRSKTVEAGSHQVAAGGTTMHADNTSAHALAAVEEAVEELDQEHSEAQHRLKSAAMARANSTDNEGGGTLEGTLAAKGGSDRRRRDPSPPDPRRSPSAGLDDCSKKFVDPCITARGIPGAQVGDAESNSAHCCQAVWDFGQDNWDGNTDYMRDYDWVNLSHRATVLPQCFHQACCAENVFTDKPYRNDGQCACCTVSSSTLPFFGAWFR